MPKVSIIIIFYDSMRFFQEALDSVSSQSFGDWELLLVDDGSSDGSTELAKAFVSAHPDRARYFEHEGHVNRGTSASRNLGFAQARGEYLIRLDSDDAFMSADALAEQVALLDANPDVGLVYGPCEYWHSWKGSGVDRIFPLSFSDAVVDPPELLVRMIHPGDDEPISMMVRRSAIEAAGGCAEAIRDYGEDFSLAIKLTMANRIYVSSRCWYRYRMHPDSYSHGIRARGQKAERERVLFAWLKRFLREQKVADRRVWRAVRQRVWSARRAAWNEVRKARTGEFNWAIWRLRIVASDWLRARLGRPRGTLEVFPALALARNHAPCIVELKWTATEGQQVNVHVGAPDGARFVGGAVATGSSRTDEWVTDKMMFFLQDASAPSPEAPSATLAVARARVAAQP